MLLRREILRMWNDNHTLASIVEHLDLVDQEELAAHLDVMRRSTVYEFNPRRGRPVVYAHRWRCSEKTNHNPWSQAV